MKNNVVTTPADLLGHDESGETRQNGSVAIDIGMFRWDHSIGSGIRGFLMPEIRR